MSQDVVSELQATCEAAARAGGKELLGWRGRFSTHVKGLRDFVTDADFASQKAIQQVIQSRYPEHRFVGEEQSPRTGRPALDEISWIVDPLDGTTNYVHGYPHYAVSVAVARGAKILAGVIFDPLHDECYSAAAGLGAFCNDIPLKVSAARAIAEALVAVSLPAQVDRNTPDLLDFIEVVLSCQAVRRSGSAALNLAHVASGSLDAFWAAHIHPWDVAAGVLLIREAGGHVTGRHGGEFNVWHPHFVAAANPSLHGELLAILHKFSA